MEAQAPDTLAALYGDALDFAQSLDEDLSSFHFLLSFFTIPSEVTVLFEDIKVTEQTIADTFKDLSRRCQRGGGTLKEQPGTVKEIERRALGFLQGVSDRPAPLHLLLAILGDKQSIAYQILQEIGLQNELRLRAMNTLTNPPRRIRNRINELFAETEELLPAAVPQARIRVKEEVLVAPEASETSPVAEGPAVSRPQPAPARSAGGLPEIFSQFGRDLTRLAKEGDLEPVCAREKEIEVILDILGRRKNNNPLLVGPAGCGKTAIVEGLAWLQRDGLLPGRTIWELNLSALVAGTEFRGVLEQRVSELITEVDRLKESLIVFIDEIHLLGSETHEMVANMLKPVLARGNFPLIGATTPDEFKRTIAKDPAMERRFTLVPIEEPEGEALLAIAQESARSLSFFHHVGLDDPAFVKQAVALSTRYMAGRSQPDKVLSLLDTLGSVLQRSGRKEATAQDLLEFISAKSRIPMENLLVDGTRILQTLPERLDDAIKGQAEAKRRIVQLLARRFVRRDTRRPIASLLLAGPSGVGKTETARRLAEYFFGSADRMVVFDMSEFQEQHAVSRLIGSPPGYTGYEDGGRLTEAFRREPYQMLLLDEIEKAHPKVLGILLQILDEGRVTDSRGFTVAMSQAIVVMTTNLGAEEFATPRLGFGNGGDRAQQNDAPVRAKIEKTLSPEMANRIDEIIVFAPFSAEELPAVTRHLLDRTVRGLRENYGCDITVDDPDSFAAAVVAALGPADRSGGARGIRRWLERRLESLVLERIKQQTSAEPIQVSFEMLNDPSAPKE